MHACIYFYYTTGKWKQQWLKCAALWGITPLTEPYFSFEFAHILYICKCDVTIIFVGPQHFGMKYILLSFWFTLRTLCHLFFT